MKLESIAISNMTDGQTRVLVGFVMARGEELEDSDVARLVDLAREGVAEKVAEAPAEEPRRRRRGGEEAASANPPSSSEAESSPRRRRRSSAAEDASSAGTGAEASTEATSTRRTRRASAESAPSQSAPESASSPSEEPRRRRRAAPVEEPKGISDADLTKACSEAARVLTPKVVQEILGEFGVKMANEIKPDDRREFLDLLDKEVKDAE